MKKREFLRKIFGIIPGVLIAKEIVKKEPVRQVFIDENIDDKLIKFECSGITSIYRKIDCSG